METVRELKAAIHECNRAARALLAEKGSRQWSQKDQDKFDKFMDDADRLQEQLAGRLSPAPSNLGHGQALEGFDIFLRKPPHSMSDAERGKVKNTMSTTTGSQGGFAVQTSVTRDFISLQKGFGWMRQVADQMTTETGADLSVPASDGTAEVGELLAQNTTATSLDPTFASRPLTSSRYSSKIFTVPIELLQDANIDIVAYVMQRGIERIGRLQNQHFTTGTGTGQPTGLVTAASVGKTGLVGQTTTIILDDLVDMIDSVDEGNLLALKADPMDRETAPGWMFSQTLRKTIRRIKDTSGRPIWLPSYESGTAALAPAQLLGYPVYINNDLAVPAANAKSLAFGNLRRYMVRDVLELMLLRFDDSAYNKLGQVGFLAMTRAGGNLLDTSAVTLYQHSAT
jgi:HK97 family phage major capsid protein